MPSRISHLVVIEVQALLRPCEPTFSVVGPLRRGSAIATVHVECVADDTASPRAFANQPVSSPAMPPELTGEVAVARHTSGDTTVDAARRRFLASCSRATQGPAPPRRAGSDCRCSRWFVGLGRV